MVNKIINVAEEIPIIGINVRAREARRDVSWS